MILNRSYEPLTVCNVKKAIVLTLLEKAEIVASNNGKIIHSAFNQFPWPSVIRLNRYILVPHKKVMMTRKNILKRDMYKCAYCGRSDLPLTVDHIIPKARGGEETWENLVTACVACNNKKGDRTLEEAELKLRFRPYKPHYILFISNSVSKIDENWKPYLFQ
ncbi:MAG: HNH endonuclease [Ignavibacteriales bacterium]|nr:HNH endonuclease [Ignavibacteriales bacterium]